MGIGAPSVGVFLVSRALDRAVEEDAVALEITGMSPHGQSGLTEGDALVVDVVGGTGGCGRVAVSGVEGDDGGDGVVGEVFVHAFGIVEGVVDGRVEVPVEAVLVEGFTESVEAVKGEGAVGFGSGAE